MSDDKEKEILCVIGGFTSVSEQRESGWQVWLDVDNQHFRVADPLETLKEANWYRRQLAVALLNFSESRPSSVTSLHPYGAALVSTNSAVPSFVRE